VHGGIALIGEGIAILRAHRSLWGLATIPVLFAFCFVGLAVMLFTTHLEWIHGFWAGWLPVVEASEWWTWIWIGPAKALLWLAGWLAVVLAFGLALVAALLVANLAAAPFLDLLSQRVESIVLGGAGEGEGSGFGALVSEVMRSFAAELGRVGFLTAVWVLLSGVGFVVPGAHLLTGPLLVAVTIVFLPLDYAGFALDRRRVSFRDRRQWLGANLQTVVGFGGVAFLACLVPGLNLLMMPALVTAGTLLVLRTRPAPDAPH